MSHLILRSGIYHVRIDVPAYAGSHPEIKGKKVLSRSLQTGDKNLAKTRSLSFLATWKFWFSEMKPRGLESDASNFKPTIFLNEPSTADEAYAESFSSPLFANALFNKDYVGLINKGVEGKFRPAGADLLIPRNMFSAEIGNQFSMHLTFSSPKRKTIDLKFSRWKAMASHFGDKGIVLNYSNVAAYLRGLRLSINTKRGYISSGVAFWACLCELEADIFKPHENPFLNHKLGRASGLFIDYEESLDRKAFDANQILDILERALEKEKMDIYRILFIAAYSGMRLEEIFKIKKQDVIDGFFDIKQSKSKSGIRKVPVHSAIFEIVSDLLAESESDYLLASSSRNKYGNRSDPFSKKFSRFIRSQGLGSEYVFHSVRKTVATLLQQAEVSEVISANILGHNIGTMTYGLYSDGSSDAQKRDAIEKIRY